MIPDNNGYVSDNASFIMYLLKVNKMNISIRYFDHELFKINYNACVINV